MLIRPNRVPCPLVPKSDVSTDCWWAMDVEELLPAENREDGRTYVRGQDTMDVWFDSGSSWSAVVNAREGPDAIADLYLEGR